VSEIVVELDGNVAMLTLAAPERRNALTPAMSQELISACDEIDANPSVGAVVVRAQGASFCAGAHRDVLDGAAADPAAAHHYGAVERIYQAFVRVGTLLPPTVAAVRGHAVGAGVNLMMATDLRVVSRTARILGGFLRLGLHPGGGHFALLARAGGREAAAAVGLFAQELTGQRAVDVGLAWEATSEDGVEPRAMEIATSVAHDPELARAAARSFRLETGPPGVGWPAALEMERATQMWSLRRKGRDR
jgi:enoyl-CoA hydratase